MEVFIIATIKSTSNVVKGYRLLDLDGKSGPEIKDVTKQQLLYVMKHNKFKLENAKRNGEKIMGIYSSIDNLPELVYENDISNLRPSWHKDKMVALKQLVNNNKVVGSIVTSFKGDVRRLNLGDTLRLITTNQFINAYVDFSGVPDIKAKKQEVEIELPKINNKEIITEREAKDVNEEWTINRFMMYMEQHGYTYKLYDRREREIYSNSESFNENAYETVDGEPYFILSNIDRRCKVVHIPVGIKELKHLFVLNDDNDYIELDTFIISKTVDNVSFIVNKQFNDVTRNSDYIITDYKWLKVNTLWFQNNEEYFSNFSGLARYLDKFSYVEVLQNYNLPITRINEVGYTINKIFNFSKLPYIPRFEKYDKKLTLETSFNATVITGAKRGVDFENVNNITSCFINTLNVEYVNIGNTLEIIESTFRSNNREDRVLNPEVNFKSKSIYMIRNSFTHTYNVDGYEIIDMSEAERLNTISNCFMGHNIKHFILSDSIEVIKDEVGCNMQITGRKIVMPKNIKHFDFESFKCSLADTLDWSKTGITAITPELACYVTVLKELRLSSNFTAIAPNTFKQSYIRSINKENNIEIIGNYCFGEASFKTFETSAFGKVTKIPKGFIESSSDLKELAIESNIVEIDEDSFKKLNNLQKVFISDTVESIGKNVLYNIGERDSIVKFYVVKGSYAHKKYKNKTNIIVYAYDTYEEAFNNYLGLGTSSERQKEKFKMLMGLNTDYKDLLNEPYLSNCQKIMNMINESKQDKIADEKLLDTSNLDMNGPLLSSILRTTDYETLTNSRQAIVKEKGYDNNIQIRFINYCNLLTKLGANQNSIFRDENRDTIKACVIEMLKISYLDSRSSIITIKIKSFNNMINNMVLISIDNRVVWSRMFKKGSNSFIITRNNGILSDCMTHTNNIKQNNIGNYITVGDRKHPYDSDILAGCLLPTGIKYDSIWDDMVKSNLIILGSNRFESINKNIVKNHLVTCYDLTTGKIIVTKQSKELEEYNESWYGNNTKIKMAQSFVVTGVYTLDEVLKKPDSKNYSIQEIVNSFNDQKIELQYRLISMSEEDQKNIVKSSKAYNEAELNKDGILLELSKILRKLDIKHEGQLNTELALAVLDSGLCYRIGNKLSEIYEKFGQPKMTTLIDGKSILLEFDTQGKVRAKYLYVVTGLNSNTNARVYLSHYKILPLINRIESLSYELKDKEIHEIIDKPINTDDFTFLTCRTEPYNYGTTYKFEVAIQHQTMETFIVANNDDIDYFIVFRFKNFIDADTTLFSQLYDSGSSNEETYINPYTGDKVYKALSITKGMISVIENMRYCKYRSTTRTVKDDNLDLSIMRNMIKDGLPNNYPVIISNFKLLEILAKQPSNKS